MSLHFSEKRAGNNAYTRFMNNDEYLGFVFQYNDSSFVNIRKNLSIRKSHKCNFCNMDIESGSKSTRYSGLDILLGFYSYHVCEQCEPWETKTEGGKHSS